jgi:heptosyltransferase-2/heptosyltransferase-3
MAEAFHAIPYQHQVRRNLLRGLAKFPFAPIPLPRSAGARILLIRPDHLGDVLLTTPAIHALKAARPDIELHALVGPWSAQVLANYPELDQVLTIPFPGFTRSASKSDLRSPYQMALTASRMLRRIGYTSAIILRPDHWWGAMLAHLAGIPHIIGYDLPDVTPFLTDPLEFQFQHVVRQNLKLVEYWTGTILQRNIVYRFPTEERDHHYIEGYLSEWGLEAGQPYFCIHPGSGTKVKQWDTEKWAQVADTLADQLNAAVILTGSDAEMPLAQQIAGAMQRPAIITAGDTQVGQLGALFAGAKVVLGPDSGPLHLAAAAGAPTVTLYGPANPLEFGSWGNPNKHIMLMSDIGCRPCGILDWSGDDPENHPCVREITVGRVLEAARRAASFDED